METTAMSQLMSVSKYSWAKSESCLQTKEATVPPANKTRQKKQLSLLRWYNFAPACCLCRLLLIEMLQLMYWLHGWHLLEKSSCSVSNVSDQSLCWLNCISFALANEADWSSQGLRNSTSFQVSGRGHLMKVLRPQQTLFWLVHLSVGVE